VDQPVIDIAVKQAFVYTDSLGELLWLRLTNLILLTIALHSFRLNAAK